MHNRKIVLFQGQIETALKNFRADLELRIKELFAALHIQSYLTGAGIRKHEGFSPRHLLFVLTNLVFLHLKTVHDLLHRPIKSLFRRFLVQLGGRLQWSKTAQDNCFILDTSTLPKRGKRLENLSFVYDHS